MSVRAGGRVANWEWCSTDVRLFDLLLQRSWDAVSPFSPQHRRASGWCKIEQHGFLFMFFLGGGGLLFFLKVSNISPSQQCKHGSISQFVLHTDYRSGFPLQFKAGRPRSVAQLCKNKVTKLWIWREACFPLSMRLTKKDREHIRLR